MSRSAAVSAPALCAVHLALLALGGPLAAQAGSPADQGQRLPLDPAVRIGTLENGLRYYVRSNDRPAARGELRLVVNAGSVLEEESQLGLAHLVEHMAFNGTASFEKQELVDYLESIGMEFGPSINAYTSFDETVYQLRVPTDDPEAFGTAFQILEDWAHRVSFDPEEVDAERGVVIEEWRLGRGAQARIRDQQLPVMFEGSLYAERLPIGDVDVLRTFPQEELVRYYDRWYRPDLMAVVAVGDFDLEEVVARIETHFGRIPAAEGLAERPSVGVPDHEGTRFAIAADPEAPGASVGILSLQPPDTVATVGDYRRVLVEQLAGSMMNQRLSERAQEADPPFAAAFSGRGSFVRTRSAYQLLAIVEEDGHTEGFQALLQEAERAARFGFTEGELERAKLDLLRGLESRYDERENIESSSFAAQYVNHYLTGSPIPGVAFRYQAAQALLPTVGLEDVDAVARRNLESTNRVVLADGVERPDLPMPGPQDFQAVVAAVEATELEPWEDAAVDRPLIADEPTPGSVVAESELPEVGVTEWRLSNGVVVWVKPTEFKDDEVVMRATSPGGWSRAAEDEHLSASLATGIVGMSGLGDFSRIDLDKVLAGKSVSVSAGIQETQEVLVGGASPRDLEELFQLTWLHFTEPREDSAAFAAMQSRMRAVLANREASPEAAFADTISAVLSSNHPRTEPMTLSRLDEIDLGTALDFYADRYADAGDFHFIFVGAVDLETMRPLVERYLASLPTLERDDRWIDLDIDPPTGRVERLVRKGVEPRSQTRMAFTGPFDYTAENRIRMRALSSILEVRLRERLREDLGGTYSVGVSGGYDDIPEARYTFQIQFGADPDRVDELQAAVFEEIERLQEEGPTALDVEKALESERRAWETDLEVNGWWAGQLAAAASRGVDPAYLLDEGRFDWITGEAVQADAVRYLGTDNVVVVTLLPEVPTGD